MGPGRSRCFRTAGRRLVLGPQWAAGLWVRRGAVPPRSFCGPSLLQQRTSCSRHPPTHSRAPGRFLEPRLLRTAGRAVLSPGERPGTVCCRTTRGERRTMRRPLHEAEQKGGAVPKVRLLRLKRGRGDDTGGVFSTRRPRHPPRRGVGGNDPRSARHLDERRVFPVSASCSMVWPSWSGSGLRTHGKRERRPALLRLRASDQNRRWGSELRRAVRHELGLVELLPGEDPNLPLVVNDPNFVGA